MDKFEKLYNEALERAKEQIKECGDNEGRKEMIRNIFPELRESEDERIRKKCIELIKRVIPSGDSQSQESKEILDCIAYLEKQKERKFDFELIKQAWYMEGYKDRNFETEPRWIIKIGEGGPKYELNPRYGQPLAEMQKPAEWSEEDEEVREALYKHFSMLYPGDSQFRDTKLSNRQITAWLKSLHSSWKPSDQDELMKLKYAGTSTKLD